VDNIAGECPVGKAFPLLSTIAKKQVCACNTMQAKNATRSASDSDSLESDSAAVCDTSFRLVCSYRLPIKGDVNVLSPANITLAKCNELVVEEASMNADGQISLGDESTKDIMAQLSNLTSSSNVRLISSVRFNLTDAEFDNLMEHRTNVVEQLAQFTEQFGFDGVELQCDAVLRKENKERFASFINELRVRLTSNVSNAECSPVVSLRLPVWMVDIEERFDIAMLNRLRHIALAPFRVMSNGTQLISPMFIVKEAKPDYSISSTVDKWIKGGIKRDLIIVYIPLYGILQNGQDDITTNGDIGNTKKLSRQEICQMSQKGRSSTAIAFKAVSSYTIAGNGQKITYETQQTVAYKTKYAIRERLGGVGVMEIQNDDPKGECKEDSFPLLHSISQTLC
jgi:hypothetical protein